MFTEVRVKNERISFLCTGLLPCLQTLAEGKECFQLQCSKAQTIMQKNISRKKNLHVHRSPPITVVGGVGIGF